MGFVTQVNGEHDKDVLVQAQREEQRSSQVLRGRHLLGITAHLNWPMQSVKLRSQDDRAQVQRRVGTQG